MINSTLSHPKLQDKSTKLSKPCPWRPFFFFFVLERTNAVYILSLSSKIAPYNPVLPTPHLRKHFLCQVHEMANDNQVKKRQRWPLEKTITIILQKNSNVSFSNKSSFQVIKFSMMTNLICISPTKTNSGLSMRQGN